ncbi:MAG: hypothetical protein JNG88_09900 [Phycisphaerales bacterium]|nr:hypothetical protein [Phycisphaerales bacterium]
MRVGAIFPLWTFRDGPQLLERAVGEIGIDHIVVPCVTGPFAVFRNPAFCEPPAFSTEGGWHFPPESKRYVVAGVRPHAARWIAQRDWLSQLVEAAKKLAIGVAARIEPAGATAAMERSEQLWLRDAWGEPFASRAGCFCNPALRELTATICGDLSQYSLFRVELWREIPFCVTLRGLATAQLETFCLCAACRQLAAREGIDVEAAGAAMKKTIEASSEWPEGSHPAQDESELASPLAALAAARSSDTDWWADSLSRIAGASVIDVCDLQFRGDYAEMEMQPLVDDPAGEMVRVATSAAEQGAETLMFTGLDTAPRAAIKWAKQAARFARRAAAT